MQRILFYFGLLSLSTVVADGGFRGDKRLDRERFSSIFGEDSWDSKGICLFFLELLGDEVVFDVGRPQGALLSGRVGDAFGTQKLDLRH